MVSDRRRCLDWGLWKLPTLRRAPRRLDKRGWGVVGVVVHLNRWHRWKPLLLIALLPHPHRIALKADFILPLVIVWVVKGLVVHGCSCPLMTTFHPLLSLLPSRLAPARGRRKDWPHIVRRLAAGFLRGFLLSCQLICQSCCRWLSSFQLATGLYQLATRSTVVLAQLLADARLPL